MRIFTWMFSSRPASSPSNSRWKKWHGPCSPQLFFSILLASILVLVLSTFSASQQIIHARAAAVQAAAVIPAYWGDSQQAWGTLEQSHPAGSVAIANFSAGPPGGGDNTFAQILTSAHASGLSVIGYVHTGYGGRAVSAVEQDIDGWYAYPVDGIFLDEVQADDADLSFYQTIASYIRAKSSGEKLVVINPGWVPSTSQYLNVADIIMAYEGGLSGFSSFPVPAWMSDSSRFAAIVENVPSSQVDSVLQEGLQDHFGYIYTLPDSQDYGQLPSYWSAEASSLAGTSGPTAQTGTNQPSTDPSSTNTNTPVATGTGTPPSASCTGSTVCTGTITVGGQSCSFSFVNNTLTMTCPTQQAALPFNNVGIHDDQQVTGADFDGSKDSYSLQALQAAGLTAGAHFVAHDVTFTWPNVTAGAADNVQAQGQVIPVVPVKNASTLAFVGAASNGVASGNATITYQDGTTQTFTLGFSDWTLNGGTAQIASNNDFVAVTSYGDDATGPSTQMPCLFYTDVKLQAGKTIASVTLPATTTGGKLHVFAIGTK